MEDVVVKHREKDGFRRGMAELIHIAVTPPPPLSLPLSLQTAVAVTPVTCMITGSHVTTTRKPQFSEEDPRSRVESSFLPISLVLT